MKINKRRGKLCFICGKEAKIISSKNWARSKAGLIGEFTRHVLMVKAGNRALKTNRAESNSVPDVRYCCDRAWVPNRGIRKDGMKQ